MTTESKEIQALRAERDKLRETLEESERQAVEQRFLALEAENEALNDRLKALEIARAHEDGAAEVVATQKPGAPQIVSQELTRADYKKGGLFVGGGGAVALLIEIFNYISSLL
jgi:hypothetical protein